MKIHVQSDQHLEFAPLANSIEGVDVIVCAGDLIPLNCAAHVASAIDYLTELKTRAKEVVWILGNHEFYQSEMADVLAAAEMVAEQSETHFLDIWGKKDQVEIDGKVFWGTTFWTDVNKADPLAASHIGLALNDFRVIREGGLRFTPERSAEINAESRARINWDADVIVTHHAPMPFTHPRFPVNVISYAFGNTELGHAIANSSVKLWAYGHNHWSDQYEIRGTRVVSNQRGYQFATEKEETNWDPNLIIDLEANP